MHTMGQRIMKTARIQGFSMIELAVTLAIIGVLMAAVMPNIGEWIANSRVRSSAESLQAGLQTARNEAVKRNRPITFWLVSLNDDKVMDNSCKLASNAGSWVISVNSPEDNCGAAASTTVDPMIVLTHPAGESGSNLVVDALTADGSQAASSVTFNGFGQITGANDIGRINVSSNNAPRNLRLVLSSSGSIFMCDPQVSDDKDPRFCPN